MSIRVGSKQPFYVHADDQDVFGFAKPTSIEARAAPWRADLGAGSGFLMQVPSANTLSR
jgi:hypothetical protein